MFPRAKLVLAVATGKIAVSSATAAILFESISNSIGVDTRWSTEAERKGFEKLPGFFITYPSGETIGRGRMRHEPFYAYAYFHVSS